METRIVTSAFIPKKRTPAIHSGSSAISTAIIIFCVESPNVKCGLGER